MTDSPKDQKTASQPFAEVVKKADSKRSAAENRRVAKAEQVASEQKAAVVDKVHGLAR